MPQWGNLWWRLVRRGFRLLYNEMAFTYDGVSYIVSLGAWRCWQRATLAHLPHPGAGRILEIAHGTGNLQLDLHAAGYNVVGYDLSAAMGYIAQRKLRRRGYSVQLTRGMAQQLPFADDSFAAIVSTFPTDFIVQPDTLREVYRVLQVGGCFVVVLNGAFTGSSVFERFLEWLYRITGQREEGTVDFKSFFAGHGFAVSSAEATCPRSVVQLVIMRKIAPAETS